MSRDNSTTARARTQDTALPTAYYSKNFNLKKNEIPSQRRRGWLFHHHLSVAELERGLHHPARVVLQGDDHDLPLDELQKLLH